ncbi:MAG: hypothetical protein QG625_3556 [Cyanobacteriota bacterium erpe_2018_sw_39hr_WHONDRS-SW48-000098_B_bin.30]|jgi:hypothetical protein|nr:hypothetical protein [Cyanobacteriota bacterium erpe_2018_sw_39hr_WHONDRS-SW48-000098_B_bin.30]
MKHRCLLIVPPLVALALFIGGGDISAQNVSHKLHQIESCVFEPELKLPQSMENRREELKGIIIGAQRRLKGFAVKYDWQYLLIDPIVEQVELFESKEAYDTHLRKTNPQEKDIAIPIGYSANFEGSTFFAVAPEIYAKNVPQFVESDSYEKLLTHELAHRLHTKLVNGHEDKMGPIWFWEGFATFAASQFENDRTMLKQQEINNLLNDDKRGDYRKYNRIFKHFVKLIPLPEFVRRAASEKNLADWLIKNANP